MKKYLITGAAGFIGSHTAQRFIDDGHEVWTIDNLRTGDESRIPPGVRFIHGSCQDDEVIDQLQKTSFDAIIHLAGQSSGQISFEDPDYDFQTNVVSTLKLAQCALRTKSFRFIYASSMSVYGHVPDQPIPETWTVNPISFYGIGKLTSERYLEMYKEKGLLPTSVRFFNVYGPNQNMHNLKQGMISIYLAQLLKDESVVVKGSLDRFRDFVYIDDAVDFICRIVHEENAVGRSLNCATGVKTTVDDLLGKLIRISGVSKKIRQEGSTPGDQKGIYGDTAFVREKFGFVPRTNLDAGLTQMIEWARCAAW